MSLHRLLIIILFLAGSLTMTGQEQFYNPGSIREIRILFAEPNWRHILDSLFETTGDEGKLTGTVIIDGHTCYKAGIRYKGYSSYNTNEIKNPFNIDLDYTIRNQNHLGFVKIKLSNVIHDPSFIREVLSYEIARKYLPASGANFANLYINDTLIGLYTNVEAVDEKFVMKNWGTGQNSFFKGEPVKLQYPFGQNANLALSHGEDSAGYYPYYNMESTAGWNDLFNLIDHLDMGADSVEQALDIDRALWMHAFNEVLLNLDSYIGYAQNYYLYRDNNGRFNPILWDMNMSFGSFRDSDGSTHFLGLTIPQIKQLDPLALMDFSVSPRPLMTRLFSNDTLRKIYFAHMRTIVEENFRNGWYFTRGQELQNIIDADVLRDTNRFYSYEDFHSNLSVTVGGTGSMKEYPGIKDLMEARVACLDTMAGFSGQPVIYETGYVPEVPVKGESCWITARIEGADRTYLGYRCSSDGIFLKVTMSDDGMHQDGVAGDGIYGAMIPVAGHTLQYYLYAGNDQACVLSPERAEYEFHTIQPMIEEGDLVMNELQADNNGDGWIELFNTTTEPLNVGGMLLTYDILMSGGYPLADSVIPAKKYLVIHQLMNPGDGKSSFSRLISPDGGSLRLYNALGFMVDSVTYGLQAPGKSTGRYPNGYGRFTYMYPTKEGYNTMGTTPASGFLLYPNPADEQISIEMQNHSEPVELTIFNMNGNAVLENNDLYRSCGAGPALHQIDVSKLGSGLYVVKVSCEVETALQKLIIF